MNPIFKSVFRLLSNSGALSITAPSTPAPITPIDVTSVSSGSLQQGTTQNLSIYGNSFVTGCVASVSGADVTVNSTTFISSTELTANITVGGAAALTQRNLTVTNPDTSADTLTNAFTVQAYNPLVIDGAWLSANGPSPYYLDTAGATYELATNVTTNGTAFAIIASGITFDLNGYTITYDNSTPITIPNGSFENGTGAAADDWDFTNASAAERFAGTYLINEIYDGAYSIKFPDTTISEYIESESTIELLANTTYSLSAMFEYGGSGDWNNPGVKGYVQLIGATTREVAYTATNWRGIQFTENFFTTGGTNETYTVRVGIVGHASGIRPYFIDDVKVQRTRCRGVYVGPQSWSGAANNGDLTRFGTSNNSTVRNGSIVQGSGASTWAHGMMMTRNNNLTVDSVNITVHGANTSVLFGHDQGTTQFITVSDNTFTSNVETVTNRDAFNGAMITGGIKGTFIGNTLENGPHAGIVAAFSLIDGNTVRLKTKYTNAFAINGGGPGAIIRNNIIESHTGEYSSRGIGSSGSTDPNNPTLIYNNTVRVQNLLNNQEYQGQFPLGAYGIQLEDFRNVRVYDNFVYAYGGEAAAYALRMTNSHADGNVEVYNNLFEAISSSGGRCAPAAIFGVPAGRVTLSNNTLKSNRGIIGPSVNSYLTFEDSTIDISEISDTSRMFESDYAVTQALNSVMTFVDPVFASASSRTKFEAASVVNYANGAASNQLAFNSTWTTTFHAVDSVPTNLVGAVVSVETIQATVVASGVTGAGGLYVAEIKEFQTQGATKTVYNPHAITATSGALSYSDTATINSTSTIQMELV